MNDATDDPRRWAKVLDSVDLDASPTYLPSDGVLDDCQNALGIVFPQSYRQFIQLYGAGMLSGWCRFYAPGHGIKTHADMVYWNLNHMRRVIDRETTNACARQLVVFGNIWSGEEYGWNPHEVTCKAPREYAIYAVSRDLDTATKLANTFPEFIGDFCLGGGLVSFLALDEPLEEPRTRYEIF